MFFRSLVCAITLVSLLGCGLEVGEKTKAQEEIDLSGSFGSCLRRIGPTVEGFVKASLSEKDLISFFDCTKAVLLQFESRVEGEHPNLYLPAELREYLQKFFMPDRRLTEGFVSETMRWKAAFVGGSDQVFTRQEFHHFIHVLGEIKKIALNLRPHMATLNPSVGKKAGASELAAAELALKQAAQHLGSIFLVQGEAYQLSSFADFVFEFRRFMKWDQEAEQKAFGQKWGEFLMVFKAAMVAPPMDQVKVREWPRLLEAASGWWMTYLRWDQGLEVSKLLTGGSPLALISSVESVFSQLQGAIQSQPKNRIDLAQWDDLLDFMARYEMMPIKLDAATAKRALRLLLTRVFGESSLASSQRTSEGLDTSTLNRVREDFYSWVGTQGFLREEFQKKLIESTSSSFHFLNWDALGFPDLLPEFGYPDVIYRPGGDQNIQNFLQDVLGRLPFMFRFGSPRMNFIPASRRDRDIVDANYYDLSVKTALYPFVKWLARGYSEDPVRGQKASGLEIGEAESLSRDLRPILESLQLMHPEASDSGSRVFLESNLFTVSGNGIEKPDPDRPRVHLLEPAEGIEYVSFLISNVRLTEDLFDHLSQHCPLGPEDALGKPRVGRECFRSEYREALIKMWHQAPDMQSYLVGLSDQRWNLFVDLLLESTKKWNDHPTAPSWVQSTQWSTMTMILHYVEAMMIHFDENENGIVEEPEAEAAVPRFIGMLEKVMEDRCDPKDRDRLRSIFLYILAYEKVPEGGILSFDWFEFVEASFLGWPVDLDRLALLKTFSLILGSAGQESQCAQGSSSP